MTLVKRDAHKKIMILAGEASGDLLGAHLAQALKAISPAISLYGMGGQQMRNAGVNVFIDADQLAVVGIFEILKQLRHILRAMKQLKREFKYNKPDVIILIDYPDFNLRMAKHAKKMGIKVIYYVSPQIWAWRYNRIKKIRKNVDHMAVLFPFEEKIYQKENVPVSFVGHPIVEIAKPSMPKDLIYQQFNLSADHPIVTLLPGSRQSEISRLLPTIIKAASLIEQHFPKIQLVLPLAPSLPFDFIRSQVPSAIKIIQHNIHNILSISDAAIAVSGTVTLEVALQKVPLVIIYKVSPLSYWLGKKLIRVPFIGLCNLVAEEQVAVELMQDAATPNAIADEIVKLITNHAYRELTLNKLSHVRSKLGGCDSTQKVAQLVVKFIGNNAG